jgi:hypothetical protein
MKYFWSSQKVGRQFKQFENHRVGLYKCINNNYRKNYVTFKWVLFRI